MKYMDVEVKLKTNKSRAYLWNKINSPKKMIAIEGFDKLSKVVKISEHNYALDVIKYPLILTFIPNQGVNLYFVGARNYTMAWFGIIGDKNCTIVHGMHLKTDDWKSKTSLKKKLTSTKKHFLEELEFIAK